MKMWKWPLRPALVAPLCFILMLPQTALPYEAERPIADWLSWQLGYDASKTSEAELESLVCMVSSTSVGILLTLVGGAAIVLSSDVQTVTGTAIALPILISSMWWACALSRALIPGTRWLHRQGATLVEELQNNSEPMGNKAN
jgi:hypothetical protein